MVEVDRKTKSPTAAHELARYQHALPVWLIETPRAQFVTCKPNETLGSVRDRNIKSGFDHLPITDDEERLIGVLDIRAADPLPNDATVDECGCAIEESLLMGAEVSILEFLQDADEKPFRFLVTKNGVSGLVSLSDIQRLPVRAALFASITQFEMAMATLIDARYPEDCWLEHLSEERQEKIDVELANASSSQNQVARLLYTQFADKTNLLRLIAKERGDPRSRNEFDAEFAQLQDLRNRVAHANSFGVTRADAVGVVDRVRRILAWIHWIELALQDTTKKDQ